MSILVRRAFLGGIRAWYEVARSSSARVSGSAQPVCGYLGSHSLGNCAYRQATCYPVHRANPVNSDSRPLLGAFLKPSLPVVADSPFEGGLN